MCYQSHLQKWTILILVRPHAPNSSANTSSRTCAFNSLKQTQRYSLHRHRNMKEMENPNNLTTGKVSSDCCQYWSICTQRPVVKWPYQLAGWHHLNQSKNFSVTNKRAGFGQSELKSPCNHGRCITAMLCKQLAAKAARVSWQTKGIPDDSYRRKTTTQMKIGSAEIVVFSSRNITLSLSRW